MEQSSLTVLLPGSCSWIMLRQQICQSKTGKQWPEAKSNLDGLFHSILYIHAFELAYHPVLFLKVSIFLLCGPRTVCCFELKSRSNLKTTFFCRGCLNHRWCPAVEKATELCRHKRIYIDPGSCRTWEVGNPKLSLLHLCVSCWKIPVPAFKRCA